MKNILLILTTTILFIGCSSMKLENFKETTPRFDVRKYFNGDITAYGMIKDRSGVILRTFKADMVGSWDEKGNGELKEKFIFDDGEVQNRLWKLKPNKDGTYTATANDVIGESTIKIVGNTLYMEYILEIQYSGRKVNIKVEDWLHLQEDGIILNNSKMKKFGIGVGEIFTTMIKK